MEFRSVKLFNFHTDCIFWMFIYEIYNVEFSSARIHIKKARNNANSYFNESYYPPSPTPPHQPLLLNKPPPIWNKVGKSRKTGQEKKSMFFDCYYQSLISRRETGHWVMFSPKFEIFLIFSYFLRF